MREQIIVQVTDCHLQQHPNDTFKGVNPEQRLHAVLDDIRAQQWQADALLLTGDLVHHGYPEAYQRMVALTADIAPEIRWLPGNHDDAALMRRYTALAEKVLHVGAWRILMLDSTSEPDGRGSGALAADELAWLNTQLQDDSSPCLVALHHHFFDVASQWQNEIMLINAPQFSACLQTSTAVKAVVCGHLHQANQFMVAGIPVFATPATAPQFVIAVASAQIETDPLLSQPGYRIIYLQTDGTLRTEVRRVAMDLAS